MRRSWKMLAVAATASLGLSACSIPAALSQTQKTVGDSAYLQVHFHATLVSEGQAVQRWAGALDHLTFDFNEQSVTGKPIASSLSQVNQSLVVSHGAAHVATILEHKSDFYVNVNFAALSEVPGAGNNVGTLTSLNFLLGNRWIELPFSLVAHYVRSTSHFTMTRSSLPVDENLLLNEFVGFLAQVPPTANSRGFSESGSLSTLIHALTSRLPIFATYLPVPSTLTGSYDLSVAMSGSRASSATLQISVPSVTHGDSVLRVFATFAHQDIAVATPNNPLVITPALVQQLGSSAKSILSTSLG